MGKDVTIMVSEQFKPVRSVSCVLAMLCCAMCDCLLVCLVDILIDICVVKHVRLYDLDK